MSKRWTLAIVGLLIGVTAAGIIARSEPAEAIADGDGTATISVQVTARPLENGAVEFGIVHDGERVLPRGRYLNVLTAPFDRWLTSTPVTVISPVASVAATGAMSESPDGTSPAAGPWAAEGFGSVPVQVQISARLDFDGAIEFGITYAGSRVLPERRFLGTSTRLGNIDQWLVSTPVHLSYAEPPASKVRRLSAYLFNHSYYRYKTHVDVAQTCTLDAVSRLEDFPFWGWDFHVSQLPIEGYPTFQGYIIREHRIDSSSDLSFRHMVLHNDDQREEDRSTSASGYLLIVFDARPPFGETTWAAQFSCAGGELDSDQSVQVGEGGNGQLDPTP